MLSPPCNSNWTVIKLTIFDSTIAEGCRVTGSYILPLSSLTRVPISYQREAFPLGCFFTTSRCSCTLSEVGNRLFSLFFACSRCSRWTRIRDFLLEPFSPVALSEQRLKLLEPVTPFAPVRTPTVRHTHAHFSRGWLQANRSGHNDSLKVAAVFHMQ